MSKTIILLTKDIDSPLNDWWVNLDPYAREYIKFSAYYKQKLKVNKNV